MTERFAPPLDRHQIDVLVRAFYRDVRVDESLGPVFEAAVGDHWDAHLDRLVDFWCTVMLRTRSFSGNVFGKHMALAGIRGEHFLRWLTLWHAHTDRLFAAEVAREFQRMAHGIGRNLFHGFFGTVGEFVVEDGVAVAHRADVPAAR